jgi:flagellar L-ring protein precursor FlgH
VNAPAARSSRRAAAALLALLIAPALAATARAQGATGASAPSPSASPAAGAPGTPAAAGPVRTLARVSWVADRVPIHVGDLLTVVVDEQTTAHEQVSQTAQGTRSQTGTLNARVNGDDAVKDTKIAFGLDGQSRDVGDARRLGDLTATLTVRVTEIGADGLARIEGGKKVTVDGRPQQITLKGLVRPEDVEAGNRIASCRIADADIAYTGKKIAPRTGFIGKLLGMLWP